MPKVAIVYPGDRQAREVATAGNNRFSAIFDEFHRLDVEAEPAVYSDERIASRS